MKRTKIKSSRTGRVYPQKSKAAFLSQEAQGKRTKGRKSLGLWAADLSL